QVLNVEEIVKATRGKLICGDGDFVISEIVTDSRKAGANMLFVPIAGENNDGHDFIGSALDNGADVVVTHKDIPPVSGKNIVRVADTRIALGDIATYYKAKYNLPTVAITGSVGKTTTKDMVSAVLAMKYNTLKTQGNFNNDIGLPLTVFHLKEKHQMAVLEMGMSAKGEIAYLAKIAKPDVAIITNVGMSHIEKLGSQENIYQAKMEICQDFDEDNLLIVNGDDKFLGRKECRCPCLTYGMENKDCDIFAENIEDLGIEGTRFTAVVDGKTEEFYIRVPGVHNVYNALASILVGRHYDVSIKDIKDGIREFQPTGMRMEVEDIGAITVINDCYNASPDSIRAALKVLAGLGRKRKIAVLGDVFEMGSFAEAALKRVGEEIEGIDALVTVGEVSRYIAMGAELTGISNIVSFDTVESAIEYLKDFIKADDGVLIKASRGMHFERIYEAIKTEFGDDEIVTSN
ncbi:MAG: UDP-N-acetylmuramoyl-tripeptide--D-alanyl-D-alanine ligase, partial [Ruminococcaceae bacterium]|nr:UDP-N-acetylmuramoyl-tripeptide--D-alanyl-D-alanine ligase [Oscillospiraceae bacterium]